MSETGPACWSHLAEEECCLSCGLPALLWKQVHDGIGWLQAPTPLFFLFVSLLETLQTLVSTCFSFLLSCCRVLKFNGLKQQFILQGSGCQKSVVGLTGHMSFGDQGESPYFSCQMETGLIPGLRAWFQHHVAFSSVLSLPLPWSVRTFRVGRRCRVLSFQLGGPWSVSPSC